MTELNRKFDQVDALLIDDIQFLAWAERTQDIFHDLFNNFYSKNKQVIISWDRPPKELTRITPRLQSRFSYWLVVDIQAPDFETRLAILESKLQSKWISVDREYLSIIAEHVRDNVRELEWALNTLLTRSKIMWWEITEDLVYECLRTLWFNVTNWNSVSNPAIINGSATSTKNFDSLVEMVANYYDVSVADIKWDSRKYQISKARQMLMYLARKHFKWQYERIGEQFWKNYATVMHSVDVIEDSLKSDSDLQHDYRIFADRIQQ
jgi:chromosomal replication initiator protein